MKTKSTILLAFILGSLQQANALGKVIPSGGSGGSSSSQNNEPEEETPAPAPAPTPAPTPVPTPVPSSQVVSKILSIASNSSCAQYSWKSRGTAPKGYIKGMALTYARSLCRTDDPQTDRRTPASLMSRGQTGNTSKDALAHYKSTFDNLGMVTSTSGDATLRSLYALGIGLGMRETSGEYCEGYDVAAGSNRSASEAEAGLFQTSYNSIGTSSELQKLYTEYKKDPSRCMLNTYKEGVSCPARRNLGSGAGVTFQKFSKECPAFAAEYAMVMLRVLRGHYGPINRREAEVKSACNSMLKEVENVVLAGGSAACSAID